MASSWQFTSFHSDKIRREVKNHILLPLLLYGMFFTRATRVGGLDTHYITPKGMKEGIEESYSENTDFIVPNSMAWDKGGVDAPVGVSLTVGAKTRVVLTGPETTGDIRNYDSIRIQTADAPIIIPIGFTISVYKGEWLEPMIPAGETVAYAVCQASSVRTYYVYKFEFGEDFKTCSVSNIYSFNAYATRSIGYAEYVSDEYILYNDSDEDTLVLLNISSGASSKLSNIAYSQIYKNGVAKIGNYVYVLINNSGSYDVVLSVVRADLSNGGLVEINPNALVITGSSSSRRNLTNVVSLQEGFGVAYQRYISSVTDPHSIYVVVVPYESPATSIGMSVFTVDAGDNCAINLPVRVNGLSSIEGKMLCVGADGGSLLIIDCRTGAVIKDVTVSYSYSWVPEVFGNRLIFPLVSGYNGNHGLEINADTGERRLVGIDPTTAINGSVWRFKNGLVILQRAGSMKITEFRYWIDLDGPVFYKMFK